MPRDRTRRFRLPHPERGVVPVLAAGAAHVGLIGALFSLLAQFQESRGFGPAALGLISGSSFAAALAGMLWLGALADRGHEKSLLVASFVFSATGVVVMLVSRPLWLVVVGRALSGFGYGAYAPSARMVLGRMSPVGLAERLGWLLGAETAGLILAPGLAALIAEPFGVDAPFWLLLAALAMCGLALVVRGLPASADATPAGSAQVQAASMSPRRSGPGAVLRLLRNRSVRAVTLLGMAVFVPVGIYDSLWARYLTDRGASGVFIGVSLSCYGAPIVFFSGAGGRLADRFGSVRVATVAMVVAVIPLTAAYGLLSRPGWIVAAAMIEGCAQAVAGPALVSALMRATPPDSVAIGQSLGLSANQVVGAGGAFVAAPLYAAFGPAALFLGVGAIMGLAWALGLHVGRGHFVDAPGVGRIGSTVGEVSGPGARLPGCST